MFRFLFFVFFINLVFANDASLLQTPTQKLADKPKDSKIQITAHNGKTYCYTPSFSSKEGYVYLDFCHKAKPARYDVFYRVSWNVNNTWLCMTAPDGVMKGTKSSGYLRLRPCVLNDKNQQWLVKNNKFYTFDSKFEVQDYSWYAFITKNPKEAYTHSLKDMQNWINTLATPPTLSIKTFIGWSFISPMQFSVYYLQNNQSFQDDLIELIYNPENGHIAQYDTSSGSLACIASKQSSSQDWNWVKWVNCNDKISKYKESTYWEFFALVGSSGALRDRNGNFLRLMQYGANWGVPYTAKPSFLEKDSTNSPKSLFLFNEYIERWNRYVNGNLGDSLNFCPSPSNQVQDNIKSTQILKSKRVIRSLPPSFQITEEWLQRFYQIARSNDGSVERIGICGVCLLHSFQILAELEEYHSRQPLSSGGYFFDTAEHRNPFISFRSRYNLLAERLSELIVTNIPLETRQQYNERVMRNFEAMAETMLPHYTWRASAIAENPNDIATLINTMLQAPLGSLWIVNIYTGNRQGGALSGHAMPVLRVEEGIYFIPTNLSTASFETYRQHIARNALARNTSDAFRILTPRGRILVALSNVQLTGAVANPLNISISNNNCTGEGDDRHGNGAMPSALSINQCFGGRCILQ